MYAIITIVIDTKQNRTKQKTMSEISKESTDQKPTFTNRSNVISGYNITDADLTEATANERSLKLERVNLVPGHIEVGGTELVFQRHGKYIRDKEDANVGSLTEFAVQQETETAENYFTALLSNMSENEQVNTYLLFLASDTSYANAGQRSYETATIAQKVSEVILKEQGVPEGNILNISHTLKAQGSPRPTVSLREPQIFDKSPDFVEYMKNKYDDLGRDFWIAFEKDVEKETRQIMGAEGPDEIADRMKLTLKVVARYASLFHAAKPDSRLVVWASTHYDTISPFVKRDVIHAEKSDIVLVDYGGGITIDIARDKAVTANIGDKEYPIDL